MNFLIVEDDEDVSSLVQYVLEEENHNVRTASAVGAAKVHLQEYRPDLIILDRGLPDQDGASFCRELKGDPKYSRVPVLFLTSAKSSDDIASGFAAGGDDYVAKPFGFVELIARINALVRRTGLSQAAAMR